MNIRPLTPDLAEKARVELNEDPKRIESDLEHIKDWLSKQPHIKACTDDQWLIAFLRGCKYSLERTKEKLDIYYSLRTVSPELFSIKHDTPEFVELLNLGTFILLPETASPGSPRTAIIRPGKYDADKYTISQFTAVSGIIQTISLFEDDTGVVCGFQSILDLQDVTIGHFLQMTPSIMKKMAVQAQDAAPVRMKGAHFINAPTAFEKILNTMKSFLNEKNRNRIYVHKNMEELYKVVPKKILPKEYGGDSASIKEITDYWIAKTNEYSSWLEKDKQNCTDESKRPGQPKTAESLFGTEGSFRQLEFD